jgi:hypothetical protein
MTTHRHPSKNRFDMRLALTAAVVALAIRSTLFAQACVGGVTVEPSSPTSVSPVYLRFLGPGNDELCHFTTVEVTGTEVRVETVFDCGIGSFYTNRRQFVGVLPPGDYTVVVHDRNLNTYSCGSFSVAAVTGIPALSLSFQLVLLATLVAVALLATASNTGG